MLQAGWESWDAWEPSALPVQGEGGEKEPSLPGYYEHANPKELNSVESWGSWDAHTEGTIYDPSEAAATAYPKPMTALYEQPSFGTVVLSGEDPVDSYVKKPAPANQKRTISQSLDLILDDPIKLESSGTGSAADIICPNCGEAKGSKGTWCRSAACVERREALAARKGKKSLPRPDSSNVFQCDEPAYQTPPSANSSNSQRTGPGAPLLYETIKVAPDDKTATSQRPTAMRENKQQQQPAGQQATPRSPTLPPNASPRERFFAEVSQLQEAAGTPFVKVPTVGMKTLDLYTLYQEVSKRGGMHEVVTKKLWKSVAAILKLPTTCTDYGFRLRRHYERYLLAYERKHLGTVPLQKTTASNRKKRKQRSDRASRRAEQDKEEWAANPYSKRAYYNHA